MISYWFFMPPWRPFVFSQQMFASFSAGLQITWNIHKKRVQIQVHEFKHIAEL